MKTLLLVAAERLEFAGLLRWVSGLRPLDLPLDYAAAGTLHGRTVYLAANGPGPRLASQAVDAVCRFNAAVETVISTGFCGGLDPSLRLGDIVIDGTQVPECPGAASRGPIASTNRVAVTTAEKAHLRQTGAVAVEMEWAGVSEAAARRGLPCFAVRVVSDIAAEPMPFDFNRFRRGDGRFDKTRIGVAALLRPWKIPGLLRLQRNCRFASAKLGEFLGTCKF